VRCLSACLIAFALFTMSPKDVLALGETGLTTLEAGARYADLADEIESRLAAGSVADTTLLGPLCIAYGKLKNYQKLFDCVSRLESRIRVGDTKIKADFMFASPADARALPGLLYAEAYLELGNYDKAIAAGSIALALLGPDPGFDNSTWPPVKYRLSVLPVLVISASLAGNRKLALEFARQLEETSVPFFGSALISPVKKNGLARAYMATGEYKMALEYLDSSALWKFVVTLTDVTSPLSYSGSSLATQTELPRILMMSKALAETGNSAEAKVALDGLLSSARLKDMGDLYWLSLYERGRIAFEEGKIEEAMGFWSSAIAVIEKQRSTLNTEASKIGFAGDKQALYGSMVAALVANARVEEAFDYVERSKSRALVDMLASKKDFAVPDPEQTRLILAQLDAAEFETHLLDSRATADAGPVGSRNLQLARQALNASAPELSSLVTVGSVPPTELKSLVGADETLIEYYYQGKDLYAFILDRERLLALRLDASELAAQVQSIRKTLEEPNSAAWQDVARRLYKQLWQPLEGQVATKNIVVVAHGPLHYLPFSALQDSAGKFLIDRYGLRFLPSASVLKYLRPVMQNNGAPLLALGNPDLHNPALDLAFAEGEAKLVGAMNPKSRVLLRKEASESNFKKAGGIFARIHFATHGKFQADDPLSSGLYLAKDTANDGVLTVGELYSMKLDADLVTLSACETGLGKVASGDDVVGLTRGFLYAGSRSIVASLWSVDDQATAALMQAFYGNLATMNKREALRQAQLRARLAFPHPFYWAAFQLTGRAE